MNVKIIFVLWCFVEAGLAKPFVELAAASSETSATNDTMFPVVDDVMANVTSDQNEDPASEVSKGLTRDSNFGLPSLPFISSKEEPSSSSGLVLPNIPGLQATSSGPVMHLGMFQLLSMPMPNIADFMGMIGKLPTFNFPNLTLPNIGSNNVSP
ncbi:uncharacterized protein LOC107270165 [Cephus cinctus]|uniref:Uncharacterized protein LOC107270165 n=1 Tax=Cephus cinctus TaxID=211228 RepID=A0AAJ7C378_CEPCN|nr:uncharacterized protein LOC107270165 [Cephus cinctus]XP_015600393.1 uncharacterized protein LOC107270165 [Cephus cinctus]